MKTRLKQSGFTLLEIMIVVVIVGLLASVVAPMVSKSTDDLLKEQADRFIALVK
jgi:general secretion pathway protein G